MNSKLRFPDFFIVGAPRCGTTAISRYLARNPQVCFSRPKEPHYFSRLDHDPVHEELERDYLNSHFWHFRDGHRVIGEGSVSYLYLPGVIERIDRLNPEARFVVLVRNPLNMLPSYHLRMRFLLQEDQEDFARAWELQEARLVRGEHIPKHCLDPRLLYYSHVARFGEQVDRLYRVAGRERSHVIVFDDFKADPLGTYQRLLEFIGADYDGQTEFEKRYESQIYRYRWLQRMLFVPATKGGKTIKTLQQKGRKYNPDGTRSPSLVKRITKLNKKPMPATPLTPEMRDIVRDTLRDDVAQLSELLGRDLAGWLES